MAYADDPKANPFRLLIPPSDLLSEGEICIKIPKKIIPYMIGAMWHLTEPINYDGPSPDVALIVRQMNTFLALLGSEESLCSATADGGGEIEREYIWLDGGECEDCEGCEMSGCSVPHGALKIINGVLHYRNCGEWFPVDGTSFGAGGTGGGGVVVEEDIPDTIAYSKCDAAIAMQQMLYSVGESVWDERNNWQLWNVIGNIKSDNPGVEFSTTKLWTAVLDAALYASGDLLEDLTGQELFIPNDPGFLMTDPEVKNTWDRIICKLAAWLPGTREELQARIVDDKLLLEMVTMMVGTWGNTARALWWGDVAYSILSQSWYQTALIGSTMTGGDCQCPDEIINTGETGQTSGGWYFSQAYDYSFVAPGGFNDFVAPILFAAVHDVYGVAWEVIHSSGDPVLRVKRTNDPVSGLGYDTFMFGGNSDNDTTDIVYVQCGDISWAEVSLMFPAMAQRRNFVYSDVVAAPAVLQGQVAHAPISVRADGDDTARAYGTIRMRWLYNVGSPSHQ